MEAYLDNAATTKVGEETAQAVKEYMVGEYGNPSSLHTRGQKAAKALKQARESIASSLNADVQEIIFTGGGSESDNLAIKGVVGDIEGKHAITSSIEHPAVTQPLQRLERRGLKLTILGVDGEGFIDLDELSESISEDTVLVSIMHANNEIGTIQDIEAIGGICRENEVLFHTDAIQSYTKTELDVKKQNLDLVSISSHKIHGPKGVGALYASKEAQPHMVKQIDGGSHEMNLRAGTENVPGIVGFAHAASKTKKEDIKRMLRLREKLIDGLLQIPDSYLNGPRGVGRLCNNVNVGFDHIEGESMLLLLDERGVYVSTGSACSTKSLKPSPVLEAIGLPPEKSHGSIRLTLSRNTSTEEVDYAITQISEVVGYLRRLSPLTSK